MKTRKTNRIILSLLFVAGLAFMSFPLQPVQAAIDPSVPPEFISTWGTNGSGNGQFNSPEGITTDSANNIYVADGFNARIQKFTAAGTYISQWGTYGTGNSQFDAVRGITTDSEDNIYVTDTGNHRIQKFNSDGVYISQWGTNGSGNGQFDYPAKITTDSANNIYVADSNNHRIQKFNSDGVYISQWGTNGSGNGQFEYLFDITTDSANNIYVTDTGNNRIQKFNDSGTYISQWGTNGSGNGQFNEPYSITTDSDDNIYVSDYNNRIQKFTASGTYISQWGTYGSGNGQFDSAYGITTDSSGNIYVADSGNHRIQKFAYPQEEELTNSETGKEIALQSPAGTTISCADVVSASSLTVQDADSTYPLDLVDFCLTVPTAGDTTTVSLTFETDLLPSQVTARKYHATDQTYTNVPGATITETTLNGNPALQLTYDITDGGELDDDGIANGEILDPVGLAVASSENTEAGEDSNVLADTGQSSTMVVLFAQLLVATGVILATRYLYSKNQRTL